MKELRAGTTRNEDRMDSTIPPIEEQPNPADLTAPLPLPRTVVASGSSRILRVRDLSVSERRALFLAVVATAAIFFRCLSLGAAGFSEDEINKLRAARAYTHLDFTANAEHPMLMKLAAGASFGLAGAWNGLAAAAGWPQVSPEAALRAPNALAGALTGALLFLLAEMFFGLPVASWAALLWTFDVNAIAINRIGKEDSLLLMFLLLGAWLYQRGKQAGTGEGKAARRWYLGSGASFGLMLATKYMPHFFGLHALFARAAYPGAYKKRPTSGWFYPVMGAVFLAANFALLLPGTWHYLLTYVEGKTIPHSGYYFAHQLYSNSLRSSPFGLPWWFYLAAIATKVPFLVTAAFLAGIGQLVARRREPGYVFLRVFVVFFLLPYSLVATKFVRYMLPFFAIMDLTAAVGIVWFTDLVGQRVRWRWAGAAASAAVVLLFVAGPVGAVISSAPYYSLYQNAAGRALGPPGWMFSNDEFYDVGVREAVEQVSRLARPGAVVASDAQGVVQEYLRRLGREDLQAWSLSGRGLPMTGVETWVLAQDGHTYFENLPLIENLRRQGAPALVVRVAGGTAVQVFRFPH
jgi:hypothetical protein